MLITLLVFGPMACAFGAFSLGRNNEKARDAFAAAVGVAALVLALMIAGARPSLDIGGILAGGLHFTTDGFRAAYAVVTALMWAGTGLFSLEYFAHERENLNRYWFFVLVTLGATEGVMLSADLMTAFVFFEILSFTSFTWVIHEETQEAVSAGYTYLFIAVIGGLVLFMGLLMMRYAVGTLTFSEMAEAVAASDPPGLVFAAGLCILLGFGAKAGMFPVHVWLPKAHPVAPSPASALLSGILTKVGVYGILMTSLEAFFGSTAYGLVVLVLGVITMVLGALLALFSVNLKRTLACSSMSQIGFILTGTGMSVLLLAAGSEEGAMTALSGTMLHMVNHSLIKLTLFMAAGVVVMNLHALELNEIKGWGRSKKPLAFAFALGALGISGVPLFNGYISKTLLHEGIVEGVHEIASLALLLRAVEWIFLFSGGCTFAYMLKLFICLFVEKNADAKRQAEFDASPKCMNGLSTLTIVGSSLLMVVLGQPAVMKRLAAVMTGSDAIAHFSAFSWESLKGGLISLLIGALLYVFFVRRVLMRRGTRYVDRWPAGLDLEERVYRPLLTKILPGALGAVAAVFGENKVLAPLCRRILYGAEVAARALADGTDALVALLRHTAVREMPVRGGEVKAGWLRRAAGETREAVRPLTDSFTFAMMMTCVGIVLVLGVLVWISIL